MSIVQSPNVTVKNGRFRIERAYDPSVRIPEVVLQCVGFVGPVNHRDAFGVVKRGFRGDRILCVRAICIS